MAFIEDQLLGCYRENRVKENADMEFFKDWQKVEELVQKAKENTPRLLYFAQQPP